MVQPLLLTVLLLLSTLFTGENVNSFQLGKRGN
jgi:hypothetical protein